MGGIFLTYKELEEEIRSGRIKNIYLFKGSEEYIMDKYIQRVKRLYIKPDLEALNYIEINENANFDDILNACETLPFMAEKKVVYIKDIFSLINNDKALSDKLNSYLDEISENIILIIKDKDNKLKRSTKIYKSIKAKNGVVEFDRLNRADLIKWVSKFINTNNKKISNKNLYYFLDNSGYLEYRSEKTLFELENELKKIINHGSEIEITRQDIDSNMVEVFNNNIFNLLDFLNRRDRENSLKVFDEMIRANEPIPRILFMIIRQFRLLISYKSLDIKGYSQVDIRKKLSISPYEFKKISNSSKGYSLSELKSILYYLLEVDKKQKTSSSDEKLEIEILIIKLTKR